MNHDINQYIKEHPYWYIILTRQPERILELKSHLKEKNYDQLLKTINQISLLLDMLEIYNE